VHNYLYPQKSPACPQKSPVYLQKIPTYPQKSPAYPQKSPTYPQKSCMSAQELPGSGGSTPVPPFGSVCTTNSELKYCSLALDRHKRALCTRKRALCIRKRAVCTSKPQTLNIGVLQVSVCFQHGCTAVCSVFAVSDIVNAV